MSILDGIVTHDLADVSATAQRRHLVEAEGQNHDPARVDVVPDWVEPAAPRSVTDDSS